jgi:hypothetical protein
LHIPSDEYNDSGSLFVEKEDEESFELGYEKFREMLMNTKCSYELGIITIPIVESSINYSYIQGLKNIACFDIQPEFQKTCRAISKYILPQHLHDYPFRC